MSATTAGLTSHGAPSGRCSWGTRWRIAARSRLLEDPGFTLLEVMIALAILGMSLTLISRSQQNSIRAANRAKLMTVATMLARYKIVEVEDKLFDEGFSDFEKTEEGDFKEEGFDRFTWSFKVDKVELPANVDASSLSSTLGAMTGAEDESGEEKKESKASALVNMGVEMLAKQFELVRNTLEQSIRRAQLKVKWKEGSRQREVSVVAYFTDPRKIDAAMGGTLVPPGGLPPGVDLSGVKNTPTPIPGRP